MFEPIIAPIAFALIMLGIAVFAVTRALRRRVTKGDAATGPATDAKRDPRRDRRAG